MTLPKTPVIQRFVGDDTALLVVVENLTPAQVTSATWRDERMLAERTLDDGITVIDGATAKQSYPDQVAEIGTIVPLPDDAAVLVVSLPATITQAIGIGRWRWQARSGDEAIGMVVSRGELVLTRTIQPAEA